MTVTIPLAVARHRESVTVTDVDLRWQRQAACRGAPSEVFITPGDSVDDEPLYPPLESRRYCDACPVRPECLAWALAHTTASQRVVGIWGGLTEYQRNQLQRKRERVKCPDCASEMIVKEATRELCLACGLSWLTW